MIRLLLHLIVVVLCAGVAFADGVAEEEMSQDSASEEKSADTSQPRDVSSKNFDKTKRFLPGEEVVSPTGQKTKVWSTKGPVPVSRAPEPFEDREKTILKDSHVVIDAEEVRRRQKRERERESNHDSFKVRE